MYKRATTNEIKEEDIPAVGGEIMPRMRIPPIANM